MSILFGIIAAFLFAIAAFGACTGDKGDEGAVFVGFIAAAAWVALAIAV